MIELNSFISCTFGGEFLVQTRKKRGSFRGPTEENDRLTTCTPTVYTRDTADQSKGLTPLTPNRFPLRLALSCRNMSAMNPTSDNNRPEIRATDADRAAIAARLSRALNAGQLDFAEFDERTQLAYSAKYRSELTPLVEDLGDETPTPFAQTDPSPQTPNLPVPRIDTSASGDSFSLALMGGVQRSSSWQVGKSHVNLSMMGGSELDLRKAVLTSRKTSFTLVAIMGGVELLVPETVRVRCTGTGIMGGFEMVDHPSVTVSMDQLPADAPAITVDGIALMGGVEVVRIADGARYED